jgi:MFS family permease
MRKFIEDPAMIAFLSSLNMAFNFVVGAITSYMSDRIWTRWGRRRPFLITGGFGAGVAMLLIPFAPNIWALVATIVFFQFCLDVAKPYQPLYNEVIPPPQRGRAAIIQSISQNVLALVFNGVLIAQFDRDYGLDGFGRSITWSGEVVVYWIGGGATLLVTLFLALRVRETEPPGGAVRERFSAGRFLRDVFGHRQWWMLYLLYICPILAGAGTLTFLPLFVTEQLGFTKAQLGWAMGVVTFVNILVFVPTAGFLADRISRLKMFQVGLIGQAVANFAFFIFLRYFVDYSVSLPVMIAFMCINNGFVFTIYVLWGPLVYDYIPSNRFGTVSAGFSFVAGIAGFLLINAVGLWVKGFTALFGTARGGSTDYSSMYVFQLITGILALLGALYFAREVKRGRVVAYGVIELEQERQARTT